jgi:hypothetical protein
VVPALVWSWQASDVRPGVGYGSCDYVSQIKDWFDAMLTVSGTHPFFLNLSSNPSQYCR